jgi:uncharacterized protein YozE (UPF0346 family)
MTKSFYSWLMQFREKDSAIGDIANDVYEDITLPKKAIVYDVIRDYLENYEDRDRNMFKGKCLPPIWFYRDEIRLFPHRNTSRSFHSSRHLSHIPMSV